MKHEASPRIILADFHSMRVAAQPNPVQTRPNYMQLMLSIMGYMPQKYLQYVAEYFKIAISEQSQFKP